MTSRAKNNANTDFLERGASRLFWTLFFLQLACWTLIPALVQLNAPLDTIEGFAWGREWPAGTYKHPPLQAWMLETVYRIFGTPPVGYFGLSALCTAVALWAVYRTGRLLAGKKEGFLAALLTQNIFYFNILSTEFNPNVLQLLLWALSGYAFAHALLRQKMRYWLLLGIFFAAGFYAKYSMAVLGVSFGLFLLFQAEARLNLFKIGPWLSLLSCFALCAPHLSWLIDHQFLPLAYVEQRSRLAQDLSTHLWYPFKFIRTQFVDVAPALIGAAALLLPLRRKTEPSSLKRSLLFWLAFGPLILIEIFSLVSGERLLDMWGMPFLSFIPLWFVARFSFHPVRLKFFAWIWGGFFTLTLLAFAANLLFAMPWGFKPLRGHFPGRALSAEIYKLWGDKTSAPLQYVIGDAWVAGNVAFYHPMDPRPHVWIDGADNTSQWIDPQKVKEAGAVLVWYEDSSSSVLPNWLSRFPNARRGKDFFVAWPVDSPRPMPRFGWAYLPPARTPR